ncbi:type II toxin-antitoxin system RelE/ParE family toxin [Mesonia sp. MT50]|uniref:Type II toxin-antitoxin system RelE/ParE family toxin n=1 Tax=Mesonia profundi TaxID=3070998 RepID=A0ABU0ZXW9_9FLAO|nr:type II toxin-antitoxin system RelE/ParE family toxin [Mesonia profundi]MDQ7916307.1 type II toxin-antitoxin system RelE/ParE family toxin [Mesonia profundi]
MELEIIWAEFSEFQLDKIFEYYKKEANFDIALEIIEGILNEPEILRKNPFVGQKEPLLKERTIEYRYLVYKSFKIIYSVDEKNAKIKIADVFGTRQFPDKIKRKK